MSFTPGPWEVKRNAWDACSVYVHGQTIALLKPWESHGEEGVDERAMDDARLIASAPDLLDACERVLAGLNGTKGMELVEACEMLRAAIAKARGES